MKRTFILLGLTLAAAAQTFSGLPVFSRDANNFAYVGFNNKLYSFSLPSLSLASTFTAASDVTFYDPANANGRVVQMSDADGNTGVYTVDTSSNTFSYNPNAVKPMPQYLGAVDYNEQQTDAQGNTYTYDFSGQQSKIVKKSSAGAVLQTLVLPKSYNSKGVFVLQNGVLYITATTFTQRASVDYDYYAITVSSLTINDGPVTLPDSKSNGCPVGARSCAVTVVDTLSIVDGVVVYVYTISNPGSFKAQINSYKKGCGISTNSWTDTTAPSASGTGSCSSTGDNSDPNSTCLPNGCGANLKCCGGQCYRTAEYTCFTRPDGKKQLCHNPDQLCGNACYDTRSYTCASGQLVGR